MTYSIPAADANVAAHLTAVRDMTHDQRDRVDAFLIGALAGHVDRETFARVLDDAVAAALDARLGR